MERKRDSVLINIAAESLWLEVRDWGWRNFPIIDQIKDTDARCGEQESRLISANVSILARPGLI
jgi:hypothetical protein